MVTVTVSRSVTSQRIALMPWLHVKLNTETILKVFQNNFISHVTTALHCSCHDTGLIAENFVLVSVLVSVLSNTTYTTVGPSFRSP